MLAQVTDTDFDVIPKIDINVMGTSAEAVPVTVASAPVKFLVTLVEPKAEFLKFAVNTFLAMTPCVS